MRSTIEYGNELGETIAMHMLKSAPGWGVRVAKLRSGQYVAQRVTPPVYRGSGKVCVPVSQPGTEAQARSAANREWVALRDQ